MWSCPLCARPCTRCAAEVGTVATILGARPQFVKAAVVSRALRTADLREVLIHTGQHYDDALSQVFFDELGLPAPDHHLGIGSGPHGAQTGRMLEQIEAVLQAAPPDVVLVYGDTNSTLAGALAAVKLHLPVAHVEAGLRSFNRRMPEEVNRVLTDHASDLLFAPTDTAVENLRREGLPEARLHQVGDVMLDAAQHFGARAEAHSTVLERHGLTPGTYVLTTVHRAENTEDPNRLRALFAGLGALAQEHPVVCPLHPRTRHALTREGLLEAAEAALTVLPPVGYLDMVRLERGARLIATDSGGVQKEAFFHGVPCLTLRDETEWTELVGAGWNRLCPPSDAHRLPEVAAAHLHAPRHPIAPYGDGTAADQIAQILTKVSREP